MKKAPECCPAGSWPALKVDYKPQGSTFNLADTTVYHVTQTNNEHVLIIVSDIFGAFSGRHQSVADTYAKLGYSVYIPEFLPKPYDPKTQENIMDNIKNQSWQIIESRFKAFHEYLTSKGIKQFYAVGFCWGVWAGFKFASKFQGFLGFCGFHPSFGLCGLFGQNEAALIDSVKCPAFFCPAQNDPSNIKQGGEHVEHLKKKFGNKVGTKSFPEQVHGWVVRGDVSQPSVIRDVEEALRLSLQFFKNL